MIKCILLLLFFALPPVAIHPNETVLFVTTAKEVQVVFVVQADTSFGPGSIEIRRHWDYEKFGTSRPSTPIHTIELKGKRTRAVLSMTDGIYSIIPPPPFTIFPDETDLHVGKEDLLIKEKKLLSRKGVSLRLRWIHPILVGGYISAAPRSQCVLDQITKIEFISNRERKEAMVRKIFDRVRYSVELESDQAYEPSFYIEDDADFPWVALLDVNPDSIRCNKYWRQQHVDIDLTLSMKGEGTIHKNLLISAPFEIENLYFIAKPPTEISMENYAQYLIESGSSPIWKLRTGEYLVEAVSTDGIYRRKVCLPMLENCPGQASRTDFTVELGVDYAVPYSLVSKIEDEIETQIYDDSLAFHLSEEKRMNQALPVVVDGKAYLLEFDLDRTTKGSSFKWSVDKSAYEAFDFSDKDVECWAQDAQGAKLFAFDTTLVHPPFKLKVSYFLVFAVSKYQWGGSKWEKGIPGYLTFQLYQAGSPIDLKEYFVE